MKNQLYYCGLHDVILRALGKNENRHGKDQGCIVIPVMEFSRGDKKLEGLLLRINCSQMKLPNLGIRGKEEIAVLCLILGPILVAILDSIMGLI